MWMFQMIINALGKIKLGSVMICLEKGMHVERQQKSFTNLEKKTKSFQRL